MYAQQKHDLLPFLNENIFVSEGNFYLQKIRCKCGACLQLLLSL